MQHDSAHKFPPFVEFVNSAILTHRFPEDCKSVARRSLFALLLALFLLSARPAYAACASPVGSEGEALYNADYHVMQYCNGSLWVAEGGAGGSLSSLTAGTVANTIDSTLYTQTWNWSTLATATSGLSLNATNASGGANSTLTVTNTTTGAGFGVASTLSGASNTGYALYGSNSSATGYGVYSNGAAKVAGALTVTGASSLAALTASGATTLSALSSAGVVLNSAAGLLSTSGGALAVANGGTGLVSGTQYGLPYFATTTSMASTGAGTTTTLLHGNAAGSPTWSAVGLTTDVTGTLPVANGGTGLASYTIGDVPYASASTTISKLADVATGNALISGGVGVAPSWGKIDLTAAVTGTLPVANGGTGATALTQGSVVFAGASGVYSQDNANFFWDATNHRLGIGITAPDTKLAVYGNGTSIVGTQNYVGRFENAAATAGVLLGYDTANNEAIIGSTHTNALELFAGNATRMYINAAGSVGIGTTGPAGLLNVNAVASASSQAFLVVGPDGNKKIDSNSTNTVLSPGTSGGGVYVNNYNNSSSLVTVLNSGLVGIGTATPGYPLDIQAGANGTALNLNGSTNGFGIRFNVSNAFIGTGGSTSAAVNDLTNATDLGLSAGAGGVLALGYGAGVEAMRVGSTGNVGIGTTATTTGRLIVEQDANADTSVRIANATNGTGATARIDLIAGRALASTTSELTLIKVAPGSTNTIFGQSAADYSVLFDNSAGGVGSGLMLGTTGGPGSGNPIIFGTNNAERMRISNTGNVGIGTATPAAMLDIYNSNTTNPFLYIHNNDAAYKDSLSIYNYAYSPAVYGGSTALIFSGVSGQGVTQYGTIYYKVGDGGGGSPGGYLAFSSSNSLTAAQAGVDSNAQMVINPSGQVGIGTTNPGYVLDVQAASGRTQLKSTTGTNAVEAAFRNGGDNFSVGLEGSVANSEYYQDTAYAAVIGNWGGGTAPLQLATNNNVVMTISNPTGNGGNGSGLGLVGINATSPSAPLEVLTPGGGIVGEFVNTDNNPYSPSVYAGIDTLWVINQSTTGGTGAGIGFATKATGPGQVASIAGISTGADYSTALVFQTRSPGGPDGEKMRITSAGRVGIDTTAPGAALEVNGDAIVDGPNGLYVATGCLTVGAWGVECPWGSGDILSDGNIFCASCGGWLTNWISDNRLKKNIRPLRGDNLALIEKLQAVTWDWRKPSERTIGKKIMFNDPDRRQMGLIAQDVEKVFPLAIRTEESGIKRFVEGGLTAPIVEAIKELDKKFTTLNDNEAAEIKQLKAANDNLQSEVAELKKAMAKQPHYRVYYSGQGNQRNPK